MQQIKNVKKAANTGFTLIEILVVIGMIALLAAIVIVAINPARQFAQGRNTQRTSNVNTILNAIGQNIADNKGVFTCGSVDLAASVKYICAGDNCKDKNGDDVDAADAIDLACVTPTYVPALPFDPNGADYYWTLKTDYNTGYTVQLVEGSRVQICAPGASIETALDLDGDDTVDDPAICVTR